MSLLFTHTQLVIWQLRSSFCVFRGHTVRAVTESFQMSKDAGFKVVAHMMPDLPNVDIDRDVDQFIVRILYSILRKRTASFIPI